MPLTPFFGRCLRPYLCLYLCLLRLRSLLGMARCAGRRITVGKSVSAPVHRGDRFVRVARFHECHKAEAAQLASLAIHRQVDIFDLAELGEIFLYVALLDAKRDPTHEHLAALAIVSWPACRLWCLHRLRKYTTLPTETSKILSSSARYNALRHTSSTRRCPSKTVGLAIKRF